MTENWPKAQRQQEMQRQNRALSALLDRLMAEQKGEAGWSVSTNKRDPV